MKMNFFLALKLDMVLRNSNPGEFVYNCQSEKARINAMKFEKTRILYYF